MSDDFIYVDPDRVRELITGLNGDADSLSTIRVNDKADGIAGAVAGTSVGAACSAGAQSAAAAIEGTVTQVRKLASTTDAGLATVIATDQDNASQMPGGR